MLHAPVALQLPSVFRTLRTSWRTRRYRKHLARAAANGPVRIVVGSNAVYDSGWLPTEREFLDLLKPEEWAPYFEPYGIDAILAEHVWEHIDPRDAVAAARTCYRFLRPGGYVRAAVPDGLHPDPAYRDWVKPGGCGPSADDHRLLYDYKTFAGVFTEAGFSVRLLEYFDEGGRFHRENWDPLGGKIRRSARFDPRNANAEGDNRLKYTSIILDAVK